MLWKLKFTSYKINKFVNVLTSFNNLKTKVDDADVGELKTVHIDVRKQSDTYYLINLLKIHLNKIDRKNTDGTTLIHIDQ